MGNFDPFTLPHMEPTQKAFGTQVHVGGLEGMRPYYGKSYQLLLANACNA